MDQEIEPIDKADFGLLVRQQKQLSEEFENMRAQCRLLEHSVIRRSAGDLIELLQAKADRLDRRIQVLEGRKDA